MTKQEKKVLKFSAKSWNAAVKLKKVGKVNDRPDLAFHFNAIQSIIFARPAVAAQYKKKKK